MATAGVPLWSTTAATNSSADPAVNWAEGQSPSSVNDSSRGMMASVAKWRDDLYGLTTAGTATAFTVTTNATYATAAEMSGAVFTIIPDNTSGAAPTLSVDGLTARALNVSTGVAIPTGALVAGTPYLVKYVHASTEFIVLGVVGKGLLSALDIINGTSSTTIATDDTLPIYDLSSTANRRMLVSDFLKIINALTADASPDSAADYVMTYDTSATAAKKVLLSTLISAGIAGIIAAQSDQETGTSTTTLVTPGRQHHHSSAAKAWVVWNVAGTVSGSRGVSGVADNATGDFSCLFSTAFSGATTYSGVTSASARAGSTRIAQQDLSDPTTTSFRIGCMSDAGVRLDPDHQMHATFFGDQ